MKRALRNLAAVALVASALGPTAPSRATAQAPGTPGTDCGLTTLDASIVVGEDGRLECGPPEELVVREDLAPATPDRAATRRSLAAFAAIADLQWADEESPLRGEWADKCPPNSPISDSAWRPQETMVGQLANSHVEAVNRIAAAGSPILKQPLDLVITLGDLADNQQLNEIRYFIDLFDGGGLVDPDSGDDPVLGGDGYDGVQSQDPKGSGVPLPAPDAGGPPVHDDLSPLDEQSLLDLANEPFFAQGFNGPNGAIPWYALPGNHDVKVQGTIFDDHAAWRHAVRRYATGHVKVMELAPDYQARLCQAYENQDPTEVQRVMQDIITNPHQAGTTRIVPADPARLPLYRMDEEKAAGDEEACIAATLIDKCESSWLEEQFLSDGLPSGHGYSDENRCKDPDGNFIPRLCYSFVQGDFLFIGLDTSPAEGLERGSIDPPQFEWLERTIRDHSSKYYDAEGALAQNADGNDKMVVVYSHHPTRSLTNTGPYSTAEEHGAPESEMDNNTDVMLGEDLEAMLLRYPNVILHSSGHTHENNVWLHENEATGTGYWEVNTASVADMPSESRIFEVADNGDGTLSIFSTIFEAAVAPDPRAIHWAAHDPTDERAFGAKQQVNEHWLASFGREVGYHDPQQDYASAAGDPDDRNVELVIPAPFQLGPTAVATSLGYEGATSGPIGKKVPVAAVLRDASGAPLSGMVVTFQRGPETTTAVTDTFGRASSTLRVAPPKGTSVPLTVRFDGSGIYLPTSIDVRFAAGGK
jgi:metallophosphoesterase (TIGR03767 family)